MATLNYCTIITPEILFKHISLISSLPYFNVYKYSRNKGIIFRLPKDLEAGVACHVFFEHEINLTNTIKTKTLTLKTQITFVPVTYGIFCGFEHLEGNDYWYDEEDGYSEGYFKPDYTNDKNVKRVAGLPPKSATGIVEYLNDILFENISDADLISKYAVSLGCQVKNLQNMMFVPVPVDHSEERQTIRSSYLHEKTLKLFETLSKEEIKLLPTK